jgi:hypothetical protein
VVEEGGEGILGRPHSIYYPCCTTFLVKLKVFTFFSSCIKEGKKKEGKKEGERAGGLSSSF